MAIFVVSPTVPRSCGREEWQAFYRLGPGLRLRLGVSLRLPLARGTALASGADRRQRITELSNDALAGLSLAAQRRRNGLRSVGDTLDPFQDRLVALIAGEP